MSDEEWFTFFSVCARVLGPGAHQPTEGGSWCAWTTFRSLGEVVNYWSAGLPLQSELGAIGTNDGGTWGQPFLYRDLAHVIVPREVYWERTVPQFINGTKTQNLEQLSKDLNAARIPHRLTELVLEVKLY